MTLLKLVMLKLQRHLNHNGPPLFQSCVGEVGLQNEERRKTGNLCSVEIPVFVLFVGCCGLPYRILTV